MSRTILVVDDEPLLCDVIKDDLEAEGFNVLTAYSGRKALDMFNQHSNDIELILSDVRMADGDGVYLATELRKRSPDVPSIILISGYSDLSEDYIKSLGINEMLPKPYDVEKLLAAVYRVVKHP